MSDPLFTLGRVDYDAIAALRERNAAWRLLRAANAPLILSFLGGFFVEANRGACPASEVAAALDDALYAANTSNPMTSFAADADPGDRAGAAVSPDTVATPAARYPKQPAEYLDDWSDPDSGFLRRFYPAGDDEVHLEATPALEKAYGWVTSLGTRTFVGTESRLQIVVELLRQIVHGTESDPEQRLADLHQRRDAIDAEILAVEQGRLAMLDATGIRDRYQQFSATARDLLADFRQVEENFRSLDRAAREKIASWGGAKGDLLAELVGSRSDITESDQGRSFQAFYDYLLSQSRQDELTDLLGQVASLDEIQVDHRTRGIHHHWSEAAERTQRTVRQISDQLRRFLDDQVWLENRRVIDLVRSIESSAVDIRSNPPDVGLHVDDVGIDIAMPFDRPLYRRTETPDVESLIPPTDDDVDADILFAQDFVDYQRLADNIRSLLPARSAAPLEDIVALYPIEQGAAEIVGYLALADDDITITTDDADETVLEYDDPDDAGIAKRASLPKVMVQRQ